MSLSQIVKRRNISPDEVEEYIVDMMIEAGNDEFELAHIYQQVHQATVSIMDSNPSKQMVKVLLESMMSLAELLGIEDRTKASIMQLFFIEKLESRNKYLDVLYSYFDSRQEFMYYYNQQVREIWFSEERKIIEDDILRPGLMAQIKEHRPSPYRSRLADLASMSDEKYLDDIIDLPIMQEVDIKYINRKCKNPGTQCLPPCEIIDNECIYREPILSPRWRKSPCKGKPAKLCRSPCKFVDNECIYPDPILSPRRGP
jgi:hypothetical protein